MGCVSLFYYRSTYKTIPSFLMEQLFSISWHAVKNNLFQSWNLTSISLGLQLFSLFCLLLIFLVLGFVLECQEAYHNFTGATGEVSITSFSNPHSKTQVFILTIKQAAKLERKIIDKLSQMCWLLFCSGEFNTTMSADISFEYCEEMNGNKWLHGGQSTSSNSNI